MKSKLKWFSIIFAFVVMLGGFCGASAINRAYAAQEYTVTFHYLDSSTSTATTTEGLVSAPTDNAPQGYKTFWYYLDDGGEEQYFSFDTVVDSDLDLYEKQIQFFNVTFYQYVDISQGLDSTNYIEYTSREIMKDSYATTIEAFDETGYNFLYWTTNYTTKEKFVFDENRITQDIDLYPVYEIQTFTITYLVDDEVYTTQTVNYNTTTSQPTQPSKLGYTFENWYILDQTSTTLFDFTTQITQDYTLVAKFTSTAYQVEYKSNSYVSFSGDTSVINGLDLAFYVTLGNSYNQTELTVDHLKITGDYEQISFEKETNKYLVTLYGVTSDITVDCNSLPLNKYTVTLPQVTGLTYNIITNASNYTYDGTKYTLNYGKSFEFSVQLLPGYYAKNIGFSGVYASGTSKFTVASNNANAVITSNCQIVEYVDITLQNTDNVQYNFTTTILEQVDNVVSVEKGASVKFTATANTGYYLKSVGINLVNGEYVFTANEARTIVFDVVEYKTVTLPTITGVSHYSVEGQLTNNSNDYLVEVGQDLVVTINLLSNYSQSTTNLSVIGHTVTNTAKNIFIINDISSDCEATITGVELNTLTMTFNIASDLAQATSNSLSIKYGENFVFEVQLQDAYNKYVLAQNNIVVDGQYVNVTVSGNQVTIENVMSDLTISLQDVSLNVYSIVLLSNVYGSLSASPVEVEHGQNTAITANIADKYNNTVLQKQYLEITGQYTSHSENNGQVILTGVKQDLTIALYNLPVNNYKLTLPIANNGEFVLNKPTQNVQHGTDFTFVLTLSAGYTQNINTIKLFVNTQELIGIKNGNSITYTLNNIVEEKVMTTNALVINSYVVSYKDGDDTLFIRNENYGVAPTQPSDGVKIGYEFAGWYLDKALTTEFDFENYVISSDISVYAKFIIMEYTINFELEGKIVDFVKVYYGTDISTMLPNIPQKVGYTKVAPYWDFASVGVNPNSVAKDATVVAVYTIDTYKVTFKALGNILEVQYVQYLNDAVEPTNVQVTGYTFEGWDNVFNSVNEDLVINGIYTINTYRVYFVDVLKGKDIYYQTVAYNQTADRPSDSYVLSDRTGYTVYGWYQEDTFTNIFNFSTKITQETYVYGKIDVTELNVNFIVDGNLYETYKVKYGEDLLTIPTIPTKQGYTQVAPVWSVDSFEDITDDMQCEAIYIINIYTITFVYPDGTKFVTTAHHGETIEHLPNKNLRFGQQVTANKKQLANITQDLTIELKVNDFLWLILVAVVVVFGGLITLIVIFSIKIKKNKTAATNTKDVQALKQKIDQRQAYIDRMEKKE